MRVGKILIVGGIILAVIVAAMQPTEAQLRRRSVLQRSRTTHRAVTSRQATSRTAGDRNLITGTVVQLSPMLEPAIGPSGAQGVASIFYNDVDTSLNSGSLVVTGLPAGRYQAWLVFDDPFTSKKQQINSELVAEFYVHFNAARTETALSIGLPQVINITHARQLVVTNKVKTEAQVGRAPVCGAAGYRRGPAEGEAVLAANIN